ncbi:hypothetical protein ACRALDRAFT_1065590 [Sodiomyces alcalophilus JCM 7366]|uniref:uncharacterized protein n=1 Tax=Sodiomyces alcalophilus JCM 7366 TaxID=591952 RepID=UPI0039B5A06E
MRHSPVSACFISLFLTLFISVEFGITEYGIRHIMRGIIKGPDWDNRTNCISVSFGGLGINVCSWFGYDRDDITCLIRGRWLLSAIP